MKGTAIINTHSNVVRVMNGSDAFDINGDVVVLDEALITAEISRLQAEYDSKQYQRDRKVKYDALNQLELISDDAINGTTTHKDAILAIKAEIPKETI